MPLIEKRILVEGDDGQTLVRTYYEREAPPNPYMAVKKKRNDKIQEILHRPVKENKVHMSKEAPGYTWSMGYNHCSGYYSPAGKYARFTGSSLNRDKNLKYDAFKKEELAADERAAVRMAIKIAKEYIYVKRQVPPFEVSDCAGRQSKEAVRRFADWLRSTNYRTADGIFVPIYQLSPRSRGKIKDKATAFFRACPGERVFCTLTFVAPVDDSTGVALLNKYLTSLRKEFANLQYLWVAERQQTGNIHFHIILNRRLSIRRYNALWVLQQYNAGLRGQTQFGVPVSMAEIEKRYKQGTIHRVFNPVDIKKVRSIAGLSAYLTKYITKQGRNDDGSKKQVYFSCAPWHCSRGVSRLFTKTTVGPSAFRYMMSLENCKLDKSTGEVFLPDMVRPEGAAEFCVVVYVNRKNAPLKYLREMEQINKWLIKGMELTGRIDELDDDSYRKQFCQN